MLHRVRQGLLDEPEDGQLDSGRQVGARTAALIPDRQAGGPDLGEQAVQLGQAGQRLPRLLARNQPSARPAGGASRRAPAGPCPTRRGSHRPRRRARGSPLAGRRQKGPRSPSGGGRRCRASRGRYGPAPPRRPARWPGRARAPAAEPGRAARPGRPGGCPRTGRQPGQRPRTRRHRRWPAPSCWVPSWATARSMTPAASTAAVSASARRIVAATVYRLMASATGNSAPRSGHWATTAAASRVHTKTGPGHTRRSGSAPAVRTTTITPAASDK